MKKLILFLALALVMCGCTQSVTDYGIVEKIEIYESKKESTNYRTQYRVTISKDFNALYKCRVYVHTNKQYTLGDTIQITKRTN